MSDWVSVKDRLPKGTDSVLAWVECGAVPVVAYRDADGVWQVDIEHISWNGSGSIRDLDDYDDDVTHWMPLPEPPNA